MQIKGFKGIRPKAGLEEKIASFPYDVVNSNEAAQLVKKNKYSFLHVVKSEIDLPKNTDHYDKIVYEKAAENLNKMIDNGWLIQDDKEFMYIYKQKMDEHEQYGLVAVSNVNDYLNKKIKIHELTRELKEKDRINHVKYTNANTGPVFLTYYADESIDKIVTGISKTKPEYDFTSEDNIQHTFWKIDDDDITNQLVKLFAKMNYTYVADGHHRTKSAALVSKLLAEENENHTGNEEYNWFLTVLFPHNQLKILDYNRVIKDLNGLSETNFIDSIKSNFNISDPVSIEEAKPSSSYTFGMYLNGKWYKLTAKPNSFDKNDVINNLDISILSDNLLSPILNIGDPRKDERIDFVGGIRGLEGLEERVNSGEMKVAFALYPTSIEQLMSIADAKKLMPPKSTWFEPKLRSGLIIHSLK